MAPKAFNNIILGQFVLTGVPIKVYVSGRFLTLTDADDIEDPTIGFGMDENGEMLQFSYLEVEFISVQGNKVDIATYNKGMETLHSGDEAPADKEPEDEEPEDGEEDEEEGGEASGPSMSDHYNPRGKNMKLKDLIRESFLGALPSERNMIKMKYNPLSEISAEEVDAEMDAAQSEMDAAKSKAKAAKAAEKDTIKSAKDKMKAAKANLAVATEDIMTAEDIVAVEAHDGMRTMQGQTGYTFGKGDIVNYKDPGCPHFGSKGIVLDLPSSGEVRYSVTNGDQSKAFRPGDILTKQDDQLEKI